MLFKMIPTDIALAMPGCRDCPLARCFDRYLAPRYQAACSYSMFNPNAPRVGRLKVHDTNTFGTVGYKPALEVDLPEAATKVMLAFDGADEPLSPIEFELVIPDQFLKPEYRQEATCESPKPD